MIVRFALAIGAGLLLALSFPPFGASVLAPVAVALMTIAVWGRSPKAGAGLGALTGAVFFGVLLRWVILVGADAWVALSLFCAGWFALLGMVTAMVTRLRLAPLWVASAWVLQEALRDRVPLGGFPWGRLAYAQTATTLTPWASIGGAVLVTFATALAGALLAYAVVRWREGVRRDAVISIVALPVLAVSGLALPIPTDGQADRGPAAAVAAVIQGGVMNTGPSGPDQREEVLRRHAELTIQLARSVRQGDQPQPDFVIWPENSTDIDPLRDPASAATISAAAEAIGVPILVGAVLVIDDTTVANVGIVWDPETGPGELYVKQRPVPFGEYVPFRPILTRIIGRFDQVPRDFIPGESSGVLHLGDVVIGDVICFEVAYDDVVRNAVVEGGRVLTVQTNNATFAGLGQPEQQVAMSRLRAVETGRAVLVAATTGISAVIGPSGSIAGELKEGESGWLVQSVVLRDSLTVAMRVGEIPEIALSALAFLALGWSVTGRIAKRRRPGDQQVNPSDVGSEV